MNIIRAILTGGLIWIAGVTVYISSFMIPLLPDQSLQANCLLLILMVPIVWTGAGFYYRKGRLHGIFAGGIMLAVSVLLDACVTVPLFILPAGGSYAAFFTDPFFWAIAGIFLVTVVVYRYLRVQNIQVN